MRAYQYVQGKWTTIESPLRRNEQLETHGFLTQSWIKDLHLYGAWLYIYARDPGKLPAQRPINDFNYDFCCEISIASARYQVWIPDLPSMLHFLREMAPQEYSTPPDLVSKANTVLNNIEDIGLAVCLKEK